MKRNNSTAIKLAVTFLLLTAIAVSTHAQFLRTSYFMEGSSHRIQLNPALRPTKGYVNIPVIGAFNASVSSNSLGSLDIIDIIDSSDDFYNNDKFMKRLKGDNTLNASINTDILSFGFYKGKGFWSFNVGLRTDIYASVPKTMFEYMRAMDSGDSWSNFNIQNQKTRVNSYMETGVGYSREITDRLTVGTKLKVLTGVADMDMNIKQIRMENNSSAMTGTIDIDARVEGSFKGLELVNNDRGYVDELETGSFGVAGFGGAIDLGATYRLIDNVTLSAAILDLGFISWSKGSYQQAIAEAHQSYDTHNYQEFEERTQGGDVLDFDLLQMRQDDTRKSRSTTLASTLVLGGEYAILNNKVAFGALSTTRFIKDETLSELTLSANYRPKSWFNTAISYSMIQSSGKSFGAAVKVGSLMLGADYIYFGNSTKCANAYLGISVPLGAKK